MAPGRRQRRAQEKLAERAARRGGDVQDLLDAAVRHHRSGGLQRAEQLYRKVLALDPRQADAAHLLGMLRRDAGDLDQAMDLFDRAVTLNPSVPAFLTSRGVTLRALGRLQDALAAYAAAIALDPADPNLHYNRGLALRQAGQLDEARTAFDQALALDPGSVAALNNRGLVLQDLGLADEAIQSYEAALRSAPDAAETLNNLGLALQDVGRPEEAVAAFDRAIIAAPDFSAAHYNRGDVLCELGRLNPAKSSINAALSIEPDFAEAYCGRGIVSLKLGNAPKAIDDLDRCLEYRRGDVRGLAYLALALREVGDDAPATALVDLSKFPIQTTLVLSGDDVSRLRDHVLAQSTLRWEPFGKTTRQGSQTARLAEPGTGVFGDFVHSLRTTVDRFLSQLPVLPDHPFQFRVPATYRLSIWATVLESSGHQLPHIHPNGWLSGVYYVTVPEEIDRGDPAGPGCLEIGFLDTDLPCTRAPEIRCIAPEPGSLLLFPSYYFHRTVPFDSERSRISIAFDVEPLAFRPA